MKLYEVNRQIEELLGRLEPDPETGEIPADEEEIIARINELAIAREDILTYLAKLFLNGKAMLQSLRAEEIRLKDRSQKMARKQDRLLSILDRECGGEKTDLGVATLFYRTNKHGTAGTVTSFHIRGTAVTVPLYRRSGRLPLGMTRRRKH